MRIIYACVLLAVAATVSAGLRAHDASLAPLAPDAAALTYTVDVVTGDVADAGTDATVHLTPDNSAAEYSHAVTRICAGAVLFEHTHRMGTHTDTLSIACDIRASTARRLARVTALSTPPELHGLSSRWISSQRRLAAIYARTWVQINDTIDAARTPAQQATLAGASSNSRTPPTHRSWPPDASNSSCTSPTAPAAAELVHES